MASLELAVAEPPQSGPRAPLGWLGAGSCTIVLLVMALFVLYPLVLLVYGSFVIDRPDGTKALGLAAWISAWNQAGIARSVVNTLARTAVTRDPLAAARHSDRLGGRAHRYSGQEADR